LNGKDHFLYGCAKTHLFFETHLVCAELKMTPINQVAVCNGKKETALVQEGLLFGKKEKSLLFGVECCAWHRKRLNQRLL
jgi:hypothetical protein